MVLRPVWGWDLGRRGLWMGGWRARRAACSCAGMAGSVGEVAILMWDLMVGCLPFAVSSLVCRGRINAKGCRSSSPQAALFLISNLSVPNGVKLLRQVLARFLNLFFGGVERCFAGIEGDGWVGGGVGVGFGCFGEASGDRVVVDVALVRGEVFACVNLVVGEASLPDGELGGELVGEASLDEVHDLREGFVARDEDEVDVVGHED